MDGEIVEIGGGHLDSPGLDLLGLICGSEGQLGVVTEATLRILSKPVGARPVLIAFDENEVTIDFNHPLAGEILTFKIEILDVQTL